MGKMNVVTNFTLESYKKKYHKRNHLLRYTKKEIEDYDKEYKDLNLGNKYLLHNRKWALINDTYYEIPKPIRWSWFRSLHMGVQVCTWVILGAVVTVGEAGLSYVISRCFMKHPVIVLYSDKVVFENQGYDLLGNVRMYIKGKGDNKIESLNITIGNYKLKDNDDFKYDKNSGDLIIYKNTIREHNDTINITPNFKEAGDIVLNKFETVKTEDEANITYYSFELNKTPVFCI